MTEGSLLPLRFWEFADRLVERSRLVVDRPRGSEHPRYSGTVYPLDYGYLENTGTIDGGGIDVWRGSMSEKRVTGVILTIDLIKRDAEMKLLLGCTRSEADTALATHQSTSQAAVLISREAVSS